MVGILTSFQPPPTDNPLSCSKRSLRGYQWISGINGLKSQDFGIEGQTLAALTMLQGKENVHKNGWTTAKSHSHFLNFPTLGAPLQPNASIWWYT